MFVEGAIAEVSLAAGLARALEIELSALSVRYSVALTTTPIRIEDMVDVITGLHAVTLHITDVQKARVFYRDVLGLREVSFNEKANRAVFALPGSSTILTMHIQAPGEGGREPGTVTGAVFSHPDPFAACEEIKRRGGAVTVEPQMVELPGAKFARAVIADPDGNEFLISNRTD